MKTNDEYFKAGFHFTWGAICGLGIMMVIGLIGGMLFRSTDDCDKSR